MSDQLQNLRWKFASDFVPGDFVIMFNSSGTLDDGVPIYNGSSLKLADAAYAVRYCRFAMVVSNVSSDDLNFHGRLFFWVFKKKRMSEFHYNPGMTYLVKVD
jgi:hypothetical protein